MNETHRDLTSRPLPFMAAWGVPLLILVSMNLAVGVIPFRAIVLIFAGVFVWMGTACLINAKRCGRRHCYYSGPVFLAGAVGVIFVGFDFINLGRDGFTYIVWGTFAAVLLTFVSELIWGKYVGSKDAC